MLFSSQGSYLNYLVKFIESPCVWHSTNWWLSQGSVYLCRKAFFKIPQTTACGHQVLSDRLTFRGLTTEAHTPLSALMSVNWLSCN